MSVAISILESLTAKTPEIRHEEPDNYTLTANKRYMWPKQLKRWEEFNYRTLEAVYEGRLIDTARQRRSTLSNYPDLTPDVDCIVCSEQTTQHIITKWNHTIVQAALAAVQEAFHACKWSPHAGGRKRVPGERSTPIHDDSTTGQTSPLIQSSVTGRRNRQRLTVNPDSSATLTCRIHGTECPSSEIERLPKDYKVAMKWNSSQLMKDLVDDDGIWKSGGSRAKLAMPIRQAYTYCVYYGCRYGCILTTEEAFIFRIKPGNEDSGRYPIIIRVPNWLSQYSGSIDNHSQTDRLLKEKLRTNGLMEYVSVPWKEDTNIENPLTFNLALWFVHILAGNHHEVGWDYSPLVSETLTTKICTALQSPATPESHRHPSSPNPVGALGSRSISRKRRRSGAADAIHFSFTESQASFTSFAQVR
jgi:hypothetical protein